MVRRVLCLALLVFAVAAALSAKDRAWQAGTWRDVQVTRPRVVFGLAPGPRGGAQAQSGITETRTYVIETDALRFELKETTTSDAPSLGAVPGEPVTFAVEKDTLYIRGERGREHALHITRKTGLKARG